MSDEAVLKSLIKNLSEQIKDLHAEMDRQRRQFNYVLICNMDNHRKLVAALDKISELERNVIRCEENAR